MLGVCPDRVAKVWTERDREKWVANGAAPMYVDTVVLWCEENMIRMLPIPKLVDRTAAS